MDARIGDDLHKRTERHSGIELLKVFAIFLIIVSHVLMTLCNADASSTDKSYIVDFSMATTHWRNLLLAILQYSGVVGNTVFFVSSAWFLLESRGCSKRKWLYLIIEVWLVSVLILLADLILRREKIETKMLISCFAPTIFANNWYLTCYLMFYPIHPCLNAVIRAMDQRTLLRWCVILLVINCGLLFLKWGLLLGQHPIFIWITIYFLLAYLKRYLPQSMDNFRLNVWVCIIALLCHIGSVVLLNFFFLHIMPQAENQLLRFCRSSNPFMLVMVISMFNIARSTKIKSSAINKISGLSMLIYLLHENILIGTYYRPALLQYLHQKYGYEHIFLMVFAVSVGIFLLSAICAWLFQSVFQKPIRRFADKLYALLCRLAQKPEAFVMNLK